MIPGLPGMIPGLPEMVPGPPGMVAGRPEMISGHAGTVQGHPGMARGHRWAAPPHGWTLHWRPRRIPARGRKGVGCDGGGATDGRGLRRSSRTDHEHPESQRGGGLKGRPRRLSTDLFARTVHGVHSYTATIRAGSKVPPSGGCGGPVPMHRDCVTHGPSRTGQVF